MGSRPRQRDPPDLLAGIQVGRERLRFLQIRGLGRLVGMTEPRPIQEHLSLLASCEIREALRAAGTFEGEETITVDAGKPDEGLLTG
jgi:hypothetical protein